ncbi:lytic transglycosylase domain-containing protein [Cohnella xylanilytica]|uniref:Lytic transglycosylase domain-containing protein n=1 Tax=Cohnella xylanilytica TaxID=557555 RepID=A0A841U5L5_9BACL|nr:lytic transglycosylase domain-containing protein [Cohnella xylanilytica]MBB6694368.1 lytic transglycosylase domain-containing protein [Cohnella xylanilytica]
MAGCNGCSVGGVATGNVKVPTRYAGLINSATEKYGLPSGLLAAVAQAESSWNPNAVSSAGARGLFQFMPATAKGYGIDPTNPVQATDAAGKMLSGLMAKYDGDLSKALAAYNWGGGNLDKAIKKYGSNWLSHAPTETQKYIRKILG